VAGALSFGLHYTLWRGPRRRRVLRSVETRTLASTMLLTAALTFLGLAVLGLYRSVPALARLGLFQVLSAHTGSGLATVPSSELLRWGGLAFAGVTLAMALGGMASSTAGGVKSLRVGLAFKMLKDQVKAALLPDRAVVSQAYYQGGRKRLTPALGQAVLLVTLLYVALYLTGTVVGLAYGYPVQDALFESVSASANVGLSVGVTAPAMPVVLEITYILQMWLGRLEFVAVFALFGLVAAAVRGR
jgi:trk system potassium uptake protein